MGSRKENHRFLEQGNQLSFPEARFGLTKKKTWLRVRSKKPKANLVPNNKF